MESKRAKHIDIKYHFLREKIKNGEIEFGYIETLEQEADIFTKALPKQTFERHRSQLLAGSSD